MKRKDYNGKLKTKITLSYSYSYFYSFKKKKLIYNFTFYNLLPLVYSQSSIYRQKNVPPLLPGHSNYFDTTPSGLVSSYTKGQVLCHCNQPTIILDVLVYGRYLHLFLYVIWSGCVLVVQLKTLRYEQHTTLVGEPIIIRIIKYLAIVEVRMVCNLDDIKGLHYYTYC